MPNGTSTVSFRADLAFLELLDMHTPHDRDSFVSANHHPPPNARTVLAALPPSTTTEDSPPDERPASPPHKTTTMARHSPARIAKYRRLEIPSRPRK